MWRRRRGHNSTSNYLLVTTSKTTNFKKSTLGLKNVMLWLIFFSQLVVSTH